MIREHEFNSHWSGKKAGMVTDLALFDESVPRIRAELAAWDWVEARAALEPENGSKFARAGFIQVDTQIHFKLGLARLESSPSLERVTVRFADADPFEVATDDLAAFTHERFRVLSGVTLSDLNRRYHLWSQALLEGDPGSCVEVLADGEVQGWFLGRATPKGLELTLAMLHRAAGISGHHLYHRALVAFRSRGARLGFAAFSVSNTPVHNIYASLGARFLPPTGCWMWQCDGLTFRDVGSTQGCGEPAG